MNQSELEQHWNIKFIRDEKDELTLRYAVFNQSSKTKKFLVFLNGRTEYIEKYFEFIFDLGLPEDCAVVTWDHRGQGDSGGARGYVENYDVFASDARTIVQHVVGDCPYVLAAHSMGSLISLYSIMKNFLSPQKMILCSPLLTLPDHPLPRYISRPLSGMLSKLNFGPLDIGKARNHSAAFHENRLTNSASRFKKIKNAMYQMPGATYGWIHASYLATDLIFDDRNLMGLKSRVMILGGSKDNVVEAAAWRQWATKASSLSAHEVEFHVLHGGKHELLLEIPSVYNKVLSYFHEYFSEFLYNDKP